MSPIPYVTLAGYYVLNRGFDFKYCSNPGAIEMTIVKSPTIPLVGTGGGYWSIQLTGALILCLWQKLR